MNRKARIVRRKVIIAHTDGVYSRRLCSYMHALLMSLWIVCDLEKRIPKCGCVTYADNLKSGRG